MIYPWVLGLGVLEIWAHHYLKTEEKGSTIFTEKFFIDMKKSELNEFAKITLFQPILTPPITLQSTKANLTYIYLKMTRFLSKRSDTL